MHMNTHIHTQTRSYTHIRIYTRAHIHPCTHAYTHITIYTHLNELYILPIINKIEFIEFCCYIRMCTDRYGYFKLHLPGNFNVLLNFLLVIEDQFIGSIQLFFSYIILVALFKNIKLILYAFCTYSYKPPSNFDSVADVLQQFSTCINIILLYIDDKYYLSV